MRNSELKKVSIRGAELHYLDVGSGEPVVLVHGSLGDFRSWSLQLAPFAEKFRVISYSRSYHFPNERRGDGLDYSADLHADDLLELMDRLEITGAHVVSASYGSYCSLVFAHRHPDRVRSLVVAEPPMLHWLSEMPGGPELLQPFIERAFIPCRELFARGDDEGAVRAFIDGVLGRPGAFDSLHAPIRSALMDNAREMKAETQSDRLFPKFGCDEAKEIPCPVLLLTGSKSPQFFHRITEELSRCLPTSHKVEIDGASHNLNSARPKQYNAVVLDWLTGSGRPVD
jgi:pimeloyl-ACP methyl ester carboxylesterase